MSRSKSNCASQIVVDPQELTEFLRASRDLTELTDSDINTTKHAKSAIVPNKSKSGWRRFIGIACALGCGICLQMSNIIVKSLKNSHHPVNLSFWRYFGYVLPTLPYLLGMRVFKNVNLFASIGMGDEPTQLCGCSTVRVKTKNLVLFFVSDAYLMQVQNTSNCRRTTI